MIRLWATLMVILVAVAACGPRAGVEIVREKPGVGTEIPILVATTRALEAPGRYSPAARGALSHARYVVSVPATHTPGEIELPKRVPDPTRDFVVRETAPLDGRAGFRAAVAQGLGPRQSEVIVFVHGFNSTLGDGLYRVAQIVHDLGLPGLPAHFAWASAANPLGYVRDRDSALVARAALIDTLDDIARAGADRIVLVAHSMGGFLAMETMAWMAQRGRHPGMDRLGGVVLLSPDIDVELFLAQAAAIGKLPQPFFVFTNARDRALRLSARLTGERARLGTLTSPEPVANLEVTVVDVSALDDVRSTHAGAVTSPTMIGILRRAQALEAAFGGDPAGRIGLLPGTVITVQNATAIIVAPVDALAQALN